MTQTPLEAEELTEDPSEVGDFFERIEDMSSLANAEKRQGGWKVEIDDELAGVAVVQTEDVDIPLISRIAVSEQHRRKGVATALVDKMVEYYDEVECQVWKNNEGSRQFFEESQLEYIGMFFDELYVYRNPGSEA